MSGLADLRPGDIGFEPLSGAARLAMWGQFILGEGFSVGKLNVGHVFVVTERPQPGGYVWPKVVEAMPSGARESFAVQRWTSQYAYVRLPEDYPGQAGDAAAIARAMIGTPYSFASYAALAAWRMGVKAKRLETWINRRGPAVEIETQHRLNPSPLARDYHLPREAICSVLADQAWSLTGKRIMEGVAHQCVTPGALAGRLLAMDGAHWMWPGRD